jgi:hypothetical protein
MMDVLKFAFSGFWVWVGCCFMLCVVCQTAVCVVSSICSIRLFAKGNTCKCNQK